MYGEGAWIKGPQVEGLTFQVDMRPVVVKGDLAQEWHSGGADGKIIKKLHVTRERGVALRIRGPWD